MAWPSPRTRAGTAAHASWQRLTGLPGPAADRSPAAGAHARRAKRAPARPAAAVASGGGLDLALAGQPLACRSGAPPPPSAEALAEWRQHCAELLREPSPFSNVVQLTPVPAMRACGLQRMLLLVADRTQVHVLAQQSAGLEPGQEKLQLEIASSPLLKKLFQQPALLRIGPNNQDQLLPALGEPFAPTVPRTSPAAALAGQRLAGGDAGPGRPRRPAVQRPACPGSPRPPSAPSARSSSSPPAPHGMRDMPGTLVGRAFR